jgi:hypothetical protein
VGEQKQKEFKKKYEQWTYVIQGKDIRTRLIFTFSLFLLEIRVRV